MSAPTKAPFHGDPAGGRLQRAFVASIYNSWRASTISWRPRRGAPAAGFHGEHLPYIKMIVSIYITSKHNNSNLIVCIYIAIINHTLHLDKHFWFSAIFLVPSNNIFLVTSNYIFLVVTIFCNCASVRILRWQKSKYFSTTSVQQLLRFAHFF